MCYEHRDEEGGSYREHREGELYRQHESYFDKWDVYCRRRTRVAVLRVFAHLTGKQVPFISGDRAAFIALAVMGFLVRLCTSVRLPNTKSYWPHPIAILVGVLGALALLLIIAVLAGIKLPLIAGDREAFIALAVIIFSKSGLAAVHRIIW